MGGRLIRHPLYKLVYASFVFFIILPLVYTFFTALFPENPSTENIGLLNRDTFFLLEKSSGIAATIAFLSTVFGTALGVLLYKTDIPYRNFFKIGLLIPLFISPYILAVAWKDIFFTVLGNPGIISSTAGVILVLTFVFTPLSMLIAGSALANISSHLEESGFLIAGFRPTFFKIILPLIKPALLTSFVLVFIFSISEFSFPAIFGVRVVTTEIFTQFSAFYNYSLAILQSGLLVLLCIALLMAERNYIADAPFLAIGSKGTGSRDYQLQNKRWLGLALLSAWFFIAVLLPFIMLINQAFKNGIADFYHAFELLTPTFAPSLGWALIGALAMVIIGFVAAYYAERENKNAFVWVLLIVFAIPSIILGISLIKFYNRPALDFIYSGYALIIIGYMGKFSFISAKLMANAIKQIPNSLDEAAQIEGIGFYKRLQNILIPLILPSLFAAFIISFIFNLGELGMTIMLYPPGTEIMPVKIFTIMANAPQSLTSSMVLIVLLLTILIISAFYFMLKSVLKTYNFTHD